MSFEERASRSKNPYVIAFWLAVVFTTALAWAGISLSDLLDLLGAGSRSQGS